MIILLINIIILTLLNSILKIYIYFLYKRGLQYNTFLHNGHLLVVSVLQCFFMQSRQKYDYIIILSFFYFQNKYNIL